MLSPTSDSETIIGPIAEQTLHRPEDVRTSTTTAGGGSGSAKLASDRRSRRPQLRSGDTAGLSRSDSYLKRLRPGDDLGFDMLRNNKNDPFALYILDDGDDEGPVLVEQRPPPELMRRNTGGLTNTLRREKTPTFELATKTTYAKIRFDPSHPPIRICCQSTASSSTARGHSRPPIRRRRAPSISCTWCGIQDTPKWRVGPCGDRTLCNLCGLIWRKRSNIGRGDDELPSECRTRQSPRQEMAARMRPKAQFLPLSPEDESCIAA